MIEIEVKPDPVYIENTAFGQHLSFDFHLQNTSDDDLLIQEVKVSVFDSDGNLVSIHAVNTNGIRPGIDTLGNRTLEAQSQLCVFNPFHTLSADSLIDHLVYDFQLSAESGQTFKSQAVVKPELYDTRSELCLPIRGRLIVHDGHDFYAHHRRVDLSHPFLAQHMGLQSNSGRFAYDFCPVNAAGDLYAGDGESEKNWFGFGESVYAPGAGEVAAVENGMQDNILGVRDFDFEQAVDDPDSLLGNYVIIDHFNGEYSALAHLMQGSVSVQKGVTVEQGQKIGQIGFSGSTGPWVHLHYELRTGIDLRTSEGLPVYFSRIFRFRGQEQYRIEKGHIDTGDIVESYS